MKLLKISQLKKDKTVIKNIFAVLGKFLATEIPLKMMKNARYFTLKSLLVLKVFKVLSRLFGRVEKRLD